jgi:hypothetical protein
MGKVIQFHVRDLSPKKVKSVPRQERGKVIEFSKVKFALGAKTRKVREFDEAGLLAVSWPGCF